MSDRVLESMERHALVFGGSGLLGWGLVNELLSGYPRPGAFSQVTAITNRPLTLEDAHWSSKSNNRPELKLISGIDLRNGTGEELVEQLRKSVPDIGAVTDIYYFVFSSHTDDYIRECELNCGMMQKVVDAAGKLCPSLRSFIYPGGTRGYGIYIPNGTFTAPLEESMAESLPEDYAKTVAYPWYRKLLDKASEGRAWTWTEICPDAVIGFTPMGSGYSLALHWAQYLSLYAFNNGTSPATSDKSDTEVAFPGTVAAYDALFTPVSTSILGRLAIFSSFNPQSCGRQVINVIDRAEPATFRELWPQITACFGLKGVGPREKPDELSPGAYISKYSHLFADNGRPKGVSAGVGVGSQQLDSVGSWLTFDRQLSPNKLRAVGFGEEQSPSLGWIEAVKALRDAGIIF
ncbi:hypothetical protein GQ53DRAFT_742765 [Thozetella sp. PMI_491]|nr:hypothetical protein GQ53DRAFT_742765 [Thozetella sp. PMI_491]